MYTIIAAAIAFLLVVFAVAYLVIMKADTLPIVDGFTGSAPAAGSTADRILSYFDSQPTCTRDEFQELKVLLAKIAALQADIQNISGRLSATLHMPYVTKHDREQVSETASKCMSKTIPRRDLDIIFELWTSRGHELISILSGLGAAETTAADATAVHQLFDSLITDAQNVAISKCILNDLQMDKMPESPRDVTGVTPEAGSTYVPTYLPTHA